VVARNPYVVLGLAPTASDADIRAAFRKLAKKYHPDQNKDDAKAEDKFKEVAAAFDIIGDADRRKKFDRGEIDEDGRDRAAGFGGYSGQSKTWNPQSGGPFSAGAGGFANKGDFDELGDIFSELFGARMRAGQSAGSGQAYGQSAGVGPRGRDLRYRLEVDFLDAARGAKKRVTMPDGRTLDIAIPAGLSDGQTLRLKGQGEAGPGGAGDVFIETTLKPHAVLERDGLDITIEAPITLAEAVMGGKITAPTIAGEVSITVPKWTSSGAVLRLKGRGIAPADGGAAGDQYVKLRIVLPEGGDPALEDFVRQWKGAGEHAPRKHFAGV
jgi:DnaJ-class molecular chaperone